MKSGYLRRNVGQVDAPTLQRLAAKADVTHTPVLDDGEAGAPGRWITLQCKATDEAFNTQPESPKGIWCAPQPIGPSARWLQRSG